MNNSASDYETRRYLATETESSHVWRLTSLGYVLQNTTAESRIWTPQCDNELRNLP